LRCQIPNWCSRHGCLEPEELPEAMWEWLEFLSSTGLLDPASDPLAELRKPLLCYGGLDERGVPRPPGAPGTIECECHLPYREPVELLNQLGVQCERAGQDPLDVLRGLLGRVPRHPEREDPWWD
jgi:hypothetical protein